jgi:hypothetical protein
MTTACVKGASIRSFSLKCLLASVGAFALAVGLSASAVAGCQSGDVADAGEAVLHGPGCRANAPGSDGTAVGAFANAIGNATAVGTSAVANTTIRSP